MSEVTKTLSAESRNALEFCIQFAHKPIRIVLVEIKL